MMTQALNYFPVLISIILTAESHSFEKFKENLISVRNFDILNEFKGILFGNWTQDQRCLTELNAIQNGLTNSEEWAFKGRRIINFMYSIVEFQCHFVAVSSC